MDIITLPGFKEREIEICRKFVEKKRTLRISRVKKMC